MKTEFSSYSPESSDDNIPNYVIPKELKYPPSFDSAAKDYIDSGSIAEKIPEVPIKLIRPFNPLKGRFKMLQQWVGRVVETRETEFSAIISDKTNPEKDDQYVVIDSEDITPDETSLIEPGAVFYWSVGFFDYPGRGRSRESRIRFRRLKGPSKEDIALSKKIGKKFADFFKSNPTCSPEP